MRSVSLSGEGAGRGAGDGLSPRADRGLMARSLMYLSLAGALIASNEQPSPYAAFYFWIAIYAFYFFSRRQAILQVMFIVAVYAAVLGFVEDPTSAPVLRWAITMSALVVAGAMIGVLQERVARLDRDVRIDSSTELLNKRGFHEVLDAEFERARRHDLPLSLVVVEIDGLGAIEDRGDRAAAVLH